MKSTVKYINCKIDVEQLRKEIIECYEEYSKTVRYSDEDKIRFRLTIQQQKVGRFVWALAAFVNVLSVLYKREFHLIDGLLIGVSLLAIYAKSKGIKDLKFKIQDAAIKDAAYELGTSMISASGLSNMLDFRFGKELDSRLIAYSIFTKDEDITSINITESGVVVNVNGAELTIPNDCVFIRDGDINAVTMNNTGVFIGNQNNVSLTDTVVRNVDIPITMLECEAKVKTRKLEIKL